MNTDEREKVRDDESSQVPEPSASQMVSQHIPSVAESVEILAAATESESDVDWRERANPSSKRKRVYVSRKRATEFSKGSATYDFFDTHTVRRKRTAISDTGQYRLSKRSLSGIGPYRERMYDAQTYKPFEGNFAADYGERLGRGIGGEIGGLLGEGVQSLGKVFGFGSYEGSLKKNSLIDMGMDPPMVVNTKKGEGVTVRHREYAFDMQNGVPVAPATTSPFDLFTNGGAMNINPANPNLFPYLSTLAACFEEYEWEGLLFEFKSNTSESPTSSLTLGSVFMAAQYNVLDAAFTTKTQVENYEYAMSAKPSCSQLLPIECSPAYNSNTHLYVKQNNTLPVGPPYADPRLYDLGTLSLGSQGIPSATAVDLGEIWSTYQVTFYKPRLPTPAGP